MRWLVWYIRSIFCSHKWKHEEATISLINEYGTVVKEGPVISATCLGCGWHMSYWKYQ